MKQLTVLDSVLMALALSTPQQERLLSTKHTFHLTEAQCICVWFFGTVLFWWMGCFFGRQCGELRPRKPQHVTDRTAYLWSSMAVAVRCLEDASPQMELEL